MMPEFYSTGLQLVMAPGARPLCVYDTAGERRWMAFWVEQSREQALSVTKAGLIRSSTKQRIMRQLITILAAGLLVFTTQESVAQTISVRHFHKVIVSPYIQVTFVQGDEESVTINHSIADSNKLHVEVHGGTLRLYLDGAKDIPHHQQEYGNDGGQQSHDLYPEHAIVATVVYRTLDGLSLRGEETFLIPSRLAVKHFRLRLYGESTVVFTEVHIDKMYTAMYGESSLDIKAGAVNEQYYTCYGEGKINTTAVTGQEARVTTIGATLRL
jgi:Putative auto-transporter adhesin, head GIN domain